MTPPPAGVSAVQWSDPEYRFEYEMDRVQDLLDGPETDFDIDLTGGYSISGETKDWMQLLSPKNESLWWGDASEVLGEYRAYYRELFDLS